MQREVVLTGVPKEYIERPIYSSLDEMAQREGVDTVLLFLSKPPTIIVNKDGKGPVYRHTNIPVVPYKVTKM
jgi:hypothetical protein